MIPLYTKPSQVQQQRTLGADAVGKEHKRNIVFTLASLSILAALRTRGGGGVANHGGGCTMSRFVSPRGLVRPQWDR
jgi:hypothetical protein